ncbi:hypothetical protein ACWD4J_37135 [Streptomyces sp. NPDC002577]
MANRSENAKARHGQWVFTLATAEPPEADVLKAHKLTRKDAWPNFTRFLIAIGTHWGTWGEDIYPSLDRIEEATGIDRSKADRWLKVGVSLEYLAVAREGSRGVATTYRITLPGEKTEKAPQRASRKPPVPRQGKAPESPPKSVPEPEKPADAITWDDLSMDARAVFFWRSAEWEKLWKPEYGPFEAAVSAALIENPSLRV